MMLSDNKLEVRVHESWNQVRKINFYSLGGKKEMFTQIWENKMVAKKSREFPGLFLFLLTLFCGELGLVG